MLVKRLVAALVAVALVAGALWLRSRRDDTASGDDPTTTTAPGPAQSIICVPELEAACRAAAAEEGLTVTVEPAGNTVDRLAAADNPGPVLWATLASFPELVDDLRSRAGRAPLFAAGTEALASSKLVLVGRTPQMEVLAAHCGGDVTWRCVGDVAGRPWTDIGGQAAWRDVKPAHEAADTSGTGLLTFANAVVSWFGRTDIGTVDLADEAFQDWVRRLERSIPSFGGPQGTPFDQLLLLPSPNVVGTTEAEVEAKAGARRGELTVTYPAPMAQADAVLASGAGTSVSDDLADTIGDALQAGTWEPPSAAPRRSAAAACAPGTAAALDRSGPMRRATRCVVGLAAAALLGMAACSSSGGEGTATTTTPDATIDPGDCIVVDLAASPEKITLMTDLARTFNEQENKVGERCTFARVLRKASGAAATLLSAGWPDPEANGPQPVIWSPAASGWGSIVNQRLADQGQAPIAPASKPFMLTPLVIAMPQPMAEALGYPDKPLGFKDVTELANDPEGWAKFGHPEWGPFRLGKTNPNFSTSGLNFTVAEYYAATGKSEGLTSEDLARPDVEQFASDVEGAVVHYGDTTLTFLNNWYRADARGTALTYVSAVAVEEKSLLDYNRGDPDGVLDPGEVPRPPKVPLVAIYPTEGTLFSDNPLIILDAPWVSPEQQQAAELFRDYVLRPENQQRVLEFGFRPGNPQVAVGEPIVAANGVDPAQPQAVLEVPEPVVLVEVLDKWAEQRKAARVLLVMDVSGSMGEPSGPGASTSKLELAQQAAVASLDQFKDEDEVGLRIFTTDITGEAGVNHLDLLPVEPIGGQRAELSQRILDLVPLNGTPLYDVTQTSADFLRDTYDPDKINAVVLLTDGRNEDGEPSDDEAQLEALLTSLRGSSEGVNSEPVRIFAIAYGEDADLAVLRRIAEASNAVAYDASDASTINQVFAAVVSNF